MTTTTRARYECLTCHKFKYASDFSPNKNVKSGLTRICHGCDRKKQQKYRADQSAVIAVRRRAVYAAPVRRTGETREAFVRRTTLDKYVLVSGERMNLVAFNEMLTLQSNACAICHEAFDLTEGYRDCHIDHQKDLRDTRNRKYGPVRGLLCNSCNNGIGRFDHDAERLRNAADYLERFACVQAV